jgi:hypothetical protein
MALPKELKVLRDRDERVGAADEIDALEGVGGSPSCGCHQRGNQQGSQSAHYGDTVLHCEQHHEAFIR